ncbi:DUF202 domain-containing protein [Glutamicibacter sp. X7]
MRRVQPPHADAGLQPERTAQAWLRTGFSMAIVGLLSLRWVHLLNDLAVGLLLLCLGGALLVIALQTVRYRQGSASIRDERSSPAPLSVVVLSVIVCALAAFGMATVLGATYTNSF